MCVTLNVWNALWVGVLIAGVLHFTYRTGYWRGSRSVTRLTLQWIEEHQRPKP